MHTYRLHNTYTHRGIHVCTHKNIHTYIHTYIYTYIQAVLSSKGQVYSILQYLLSQQETVRHIHIIYVCIYVHISTHTCKHINHSMLHGLLVQKEILVKPHTKTNYACSYIHNTFIHTYSPLYLPTDSFEARSYQ
jgi:hypothetical protein